MSVYSVRPDGTTLRDGQPFFPLGFFNVSDTRRLPQLLDDVTQIGAAGFNLMHLVAGEFLSWEERGRLYDHAAAKGVYLMPEIAESVVNPQEYLARFRAHPAHFGCYIWDDVNGSTDYKAVAAKHARYRGHDDSHVTHFSGNMRTMSANPPGAHIADTFGAQIYPVGGGDAISAVHLEVTRGVTKVARPGQSPMAHLQTFRWKGGSVPTFAQYRNMLYQALVAGARGVVNYTFYDGGNYLPNDTALWAGLKTVPGEIAALRAYLLNGVRTETALSGTCWVAVWKRDGGTLAIAVNSDPSRSVSLATAVSEVTGSPRSPLPNIPTTLTYSGGALRGTLKPLDVQVVEWVTEPVPPPPPPPPPTEDRIAITLGGKTTVYRISPITQEPRDEQKAE